MEDDEGEVRSERVVDQPPSCIEFCPANPSIFVIGTYKLGEEQTTGGAAGTTSQSRSGRLEVYQIRRKALSSDLGVSPCIDRYDFPHCAVLDLHFCPQYPSLLAVCTSTAQIVFFRLEGINCGGEAEPTAPLIFRAGSLQIAEDDTVLATSFVWSPQPITDSPHCISLAVTLSSGDIKLLEVWWDMNSKPSSLTDFLVVSEAGINPAHALEAWTVAFAELSHHADHEQFLLSGGDDSVLALHSLKPQPEPAHVEAAQLFQDRKSHGAGVTAILPVLDASRVSPRTRAFVTGSYDEHIRVFTVEERTPYKRKVVAQLPLGGGVWRLRTLSETLGKESENGSACSVLILASCMHAGVRIVRITRRQLSKKGERSCDWEVELVGQYTKGHKSMCYGADSVDLRRFPDDRVEDGSTTGLASWIRRPNNRYHSQDPSQEFVVVSTSFYDKKICAWRF